MRPRTPFNAILFLLVAAAPASAQTRDPQPQAYSFVSGVGLGAGLWVNPGAAGFNRSVYLLGHVTFERPEDGDWSTGQYLVGLHSRVLAFGYRHDEFGSGPHPQGDAYSMAVGLAHERHGIGASRTWRTTGGAQGSWEIGYVNHGESGVSVGLVWRDIGSPEVRDTVRHERLVGAVSYRPPASRLSLSAQGDYRPDGGDFRAFRIGGGFEILDVLNAVVLAEWNGDGDFEALRIGVTTRGGRASAFGGVGLASGGDIRTASAGLAWRSPHR